MKRWTIDATELAPAVLTPPLSKSDAQRAQVLAWLTGRTLPLPADADLPNDVRVMREGLSALDRARTGSVPVELDCADGGAPFRILLGQAAALRASAPIRLTGSARLGQRPHGPLFDALRKTFGDEVVSHAAPGVFPVDVAPGRSPSAPTFEIDGSESSQFVTSLLLASAARVLTEGRPWSVRLLGETASQGYLDLTFSWLRRAGFLLEVEPRQLTIRGHEARPTLPSIPGDWSSLGYLLILGWATRSAVGNVDLGADHPDQISVRIFDALGLTLSRDGDTTRVTGAPRSGLQASGRDAPDLLPTLAALSCVLPEPSLLTDTDILVGKESDRRAGIISLVEAAGGRVDVEGTSLRLHPPARIAARLEIETRSDHRIAMSGATLAVLGRATLTLDDPECVTKSFPGFWRELEKLGVRIER